MKARIFSLCAVALALVLSGCGSDQHYQNTAAERAREYLLENARELTPEQVYFVKFNDPVLLVGPALDSKGHDTITDARQICITWQIPGQDTLYMVFGVSTSRMIDWYPNRLIRRNYYRKNVPLDDAIKSARQYAQVNLHDRLTVTGFNQIRYLAPYVLQTDFELNFTPTGRESAKDVEAARKAAAAQSQLSLVWKISEDSWAVFCGTSQIDGAGWKINFGGILPAAEVKQHTVAQLRTPEEAHEAISGEAKERKNETPRSGAGQ